MNPDTSIEILISIEVNAYMKYASIKKSLLEHGAKEEALKDIENKMSECTQKIETYEQLGNRTSQKPNINRRMLIRREAYYG